LPAPDGVTLHSAIAVDPDIAPAVVIMTGLGQEGDLVGEPELEAIAMVSKPIHREDLRARMRGVLGLQGEAVAEAAPARRHLTAAGGGGAGQLLLVEDDLASQRVALAMLSGAGYQVDTALGGAAAVDAVAARRYNAILMDCQMPGVNGYQATAAIRASEGTARHTPIIAVTAAVRPEDHERCLAEGMDAYLAKPVRTDVLLATLARLVKTQPVEATLDAPAGHLEEVALQELAWQGPAGRAGRILVAEDNPVNQRVAAAMLDKLGFCVDIVADGEAAVRAMTLTQYQAVLMDCQMPVMDGYLATSEIRRQQEGSLRSPIIAVTASAMKSDREVCLAAGMDDYITKPITLKALATVLARWVPVGSVGTLAAESLEPVEPAEPLEAGAPVPVHGAPGEAPPVLDAEVVRRLERLGESVGEDLVGQLAVLFLADADAHVITLREALAGDDGAAVARSAHTLSGASANIGATGLARLCAALEETASDDLAGGWALLQEVEAELGLVRCALGSPMLTA